MTGYIGKSRYWRRADVIIASKCIIEKNPSWTRINDTQVITETEELACSISWFFMQLRDIMSPLLDLTDKFSVFPVFKSKFRDFSNKNEFYRELAEVANKIINSNKGYNEKDILASILSKSESYRRELLSGLIDYFDREKTLLYEFENWVFKKTEIGCA